MRQRIKEYGSDMLKRGTLGKVYDYYFGMPWHRNEFRRAFREFLDEKVSISEATEKIGIENEGYFNEWFLYDYVWKDGMTTLEHFVHENPLRLSAIEMVFYETLLKTNRYGLFEVLGIEPLTSMELKDLQSGAKYTVAEVKATMHTPVKAVFFARVADVGGHYEMVGADSIILGSFGSGLKKVVRTWEDKLTPKDAYRIARTNKK